MRKCLWIYLNLFVGPLEKTLYITLFVLIPSVCLEHVIRKYCVSRLQ